MFDLIHLVQVTCEEDGCVWIDSSWKEEDDANDRRDFLTGHNDGIDGAQCSYGASKIEYASYHEDNGYDVMVVPMALV